MIEGSHWIDRDGFACCDELTGSRFYWGAREWRNLARMVADDLAIETNGVNTRAWVQNMRGLDYACDTWTATEQAAIEACS